MRIAIVGTGVSGLVAGHLLSRDHDVAVFESRDRIGGHTNTFEVEGPDGCSLHIDTGFIVYNEQNYPLPPCRVVLTRVYNIRSKHATHRCQLPCQPA